MLDRSAAEVGLPSMRQVNGIARLNTRRSDLAAPAIFALPRLGGRQDSDWGRRVRAKMNIIDH